MARRHPKHETPEELETQAAQDRLKRPLVAIVGRPNVGKSTIFNRLAHRKRAIVEDTPGVTRDRHYADTLLDGRPITIIDTGGFLPDDEDGTLEADVRMQARAAVEECQVIVFVTDGRAGLTAADRDVANELRKVKRPLLLVVNKVDSLKGAEAIGAEFHALGLGEPEVVSAEHSLGFGSLTERLALLLPPKELLTAPATGEQPIRLSIIGRPNVGKSTLVNALLGQDRVIVSPLAGTTRDPIDSPLSFKGQDYILTDTAGIRRKATISQKVEQFSVMGALRSTEDCDVAVLVLDATEAGVEQDARIAAIAEDKGRPLMVVVNKWDLKKGKVNEDTFREDLKFNFKWVGYAPFVFISAKQKLRVTKVLEIAKNLHEQANFRAPTPQLNKLLAHVTTEHPTPWVNGKATRLYYVAQVGVSPPAFAFTCNYPNAMPDRYKRYIENHLRATFGLSVPVRLFFRERPGKAKRDARIGRYRDASTKRRR